MFSECMMTIEDVHCILFQKEIDTYIGINIGFYKF